MNKQNFCSGFENRLFQAGLSVDILRTMRLRLSLIACRGGQNTHI